MVQDPHDACRHIMPRVYEQYMVKKRQIAKEERIDRCVRRVAEYFRSFLSKIGPDADARKAKLISNTYSLVSVVKRDQITHDAGMKIKMFLEHLAGINTLIEKTSKCYEYIVIIQDRWRDIKARRLLQKHVVEYMWDKEIKVIEEYCQKYKSSKKIKILYHKVTNIDDEIKDKILSNYMELRRCIH